MTGLTDLFEAETAPILPAEAERLAEALFGVRGSARALSGERDQNFHLRVADGPGYVFKIHPPAEDPLVVDFQIRALQHLAEVDPGLVVPRVILSPDGQSSVPVELISGRPQQARLLSYLPGVPIGAHRPLREAQLRSLGQTLGRLDRALRGFFHPAGGYALLWDASQCPQLRPLLEHIPDEALRALVAAGMDRVEAELIPALRRLRAQPIHNDANSNNVLLDPDALDRVAGVLDFGDMVHRPRIQELAVAASYHLGPDEDPMAPITALVAGYHAVDPLEADELAALRDLIVARLMVSATMWSWASRDDAADRAELVANVPSLHDRFRRLALAPADALTQRLCQVCGL